MSKISKPLDIDAVKLALMELSKKQKELGKLQKKYAETVQVMESGAANAQEALDRGDIQGYSDTHRAIAKAHEKIEEITRDFEHGVVQYEAARAEVVALVVGDAEGQSADTDAEAA